MTQSNIPVFDDTTPDAEILEAFEAIRSHRSHAYSFDHLAGSDPAAFDRVNDQIEALDAAQIDLERAVYQNWATTPTGVAAQLMLATTIECERWVDIGMAEQGVRALYLQRDRLDGREQAVVQAAYELFHIEWEQALATYERSAEDFTAVLKIRGLRDEESFRLKRDSEEQSEHLAALELLCDELEERFSNEGAIDRLMRTLAPDFACYKRKAEIAIAEGVNNKAAPWLVRDVNFLTGLIEPAVRAA